MLCITGTDFEPTTFPAGNAALNTGTPLSTVERLFFKFTADTNSKRAKSKNPATEQLSSPQGSTVRPETSTGQSSLGGRV